MSKMKKTKLYLLIFITFFLMFNMTLASSENIRLLINYGAEKTNDSLVTLSFTSPQLDQYRDYKVRFSLDKKNWISYDFTKGSWQKDERDFLQEFYPNFNLGKKTGKRIVYAQLVKGPEVINLSATIEYKPEIQYNPNEVEKQQVIDVLDGAGTLESPYVVQSQNVKLKVNEGSAVGLKYMTDGSWSDWKNISGQKSVSIKLKSASGLNAVHYITRNSRGIESTAKTIYYFIDKEGPKIDVKSDYYGVVAVEGATKFQLGLSDNLSKSVSYQIEIVFYDKKKVIEGSVDLIEQNKYVYNEFSLQGLPKGTFKMIITAFDDAGNRLRREHKLYSY